MRCDVWPRVVVCPYLPRDQVLLKTGSDTLFCGELAAIDVVWLHLWLDAVCDKTGPPQVVQWSL